MCATWQPLPTPDAAWLADALISDPAVRPTAIEPESTAASTSPAPAPAAEAEAKSASAVAYDGGATAKTQDAAPVDRPSIDTAVAAAAAAAATSTGRPPLSSVASSAALTPATILFTAQALDGGSGLEAAPSLRRTQRASARWSRVNLLEPDTPKSEPMLISTGTASSSAASLGIPVTALPIATPLSASVVLAQLIASAGPFAQAPWQASSPAARAPVSPVAQALAATPAPIVETLAASAGGTVVPPAVSANDGGVDDGAPGRISVDPLFLERDGRTKRAALHTTREAALDAVRRLFYDRFAATPLPATAVLTVQDPLGRVYYDLEGPDLLQPGCSVRLTVPGEVDPPFSLVLVSLAALASEVAQLRMAAAVAAPSVPAGPAVPSTATPTAAAAPVPARTTSPAVAAPSRASTSTPTPAPTPARASAGSSAVSSDAPRLSSQPSRTALTAALQGPKVNPAHDPAGAVATTRGGGHDRAPWMPCWCSRVSPCLVRRSAAGVCMCGGGGGVFS